MQRLKMAQGMIFSIFLMLWLAGRASADGGDDFANNLASDLGPIIALFGERVVMQFMSQAMGITDCILLAVAPIGAITTVVSAIRVAGPAWLKSFIGRARENLSAAEIDVMSSTSKEACELWNGESVVRCPGSADIYQFICLLPIGCDPADLSRAQTRIHYKELNKVVDMGKDQLLEKIETAGPAYAWRTFKIFLRNTSQKIHTICGKLPNYSSSVSPRQLWKTAKKKTISSPSDTDVESGRIQYDSSMNTPTRADSIKNANLPVQISRVFSFPGTDSGKAASGKVDSGKADSGKADSGKADSDMKASGKADSDMKDSDMKDSGKTDSGKTDSGKTDPDGTDPDGTDPDGTETLDKGGKDITIIVDRSDDSAPNLLLNCHDRVERGEIYLAAAFGVILQLGALIYFGFITYHRPIKGQFLKDGRKVVDYAFPCAAGGTLLLVFGLFICAWVVEKSTTETCYKAKDHRMFVVWLQKDHTVNDQVFKPFAIYPTSERRYITMSRRSSNRQSSQKNKASNPPQTNGQKKRTNAQTTSGSNSTNGTTTNRKNMSGEDSNIRPLEHITFFGALISLVGFVSQFIGMRGLNWTASIVQLGITIVLTVVRVIVRRGLGKSPNRTPLTSKTELDWFSLSFGDLTTAPWAILDAKSNSGLEIDVSEDEKSPKWSIRTGGEQKYFPLKKPHLTIRQDKDNSAAHKMMLTRHRLGYLSQWKNPVWEEAARLSRAIEAVAEAFLENLAEEKLLWKVPATYRNKEENIYINLKRKNAKWKVKDEKFEAILSLWLYSTPSATLSDTNQSGNLRLYGPSQLKDRLLRDLGWWMPDTIPEISTWEKIKIDEIKETNETNETNREKPKRTIVGFTSEPHGGNETEEKADTEEKVDPVDKYLALECQDKPERLFSRDLLFSFICAVAKMPEVTIESAGCEGQLNYSKMEKGWKQMKLKNDTISKLTRKLEKIGFGTMSDIHWDLIVPLSLGQKLTNVKKVIDEATKQAQQYERSRQWKKLVDTCSCLLDLATQFDNQESSGSLALAVCLEFLHRLRHEAALQESEGRSEEELATQLEILEANFVDERFVTSTRFSRPMRLPTDEWHYAMSFNILIGSAPDSNWQVPASFGIVSEHREILDENKTDAERPVYWDPGVLAKADAFGWSPLHYAASFHSHNLRIVFPETGEVLNLRDLMGWTPLQHACLHGNEKVVDLLLDHDAPIEVGGYDGVTPLHCAVRSGNLDILEQLVGKIKSGRQKHTRKGIAHVDRNERHPIHWAAVKGDIDLVRLLKDDINLTDRFGWTCTHLAAIYGHKALIEYIIEDCVINLNMGDNDSRTPLYLAAENKSLAAVDVLLKAGADVNAKAKDGSTPLHKAVNLEGVAPLLLEEGADIMAADIEGRTPLYQALAHGATDVAALLIELGADISIAAKDGRTPLHMAVKHRDIAQKLIKKGANIEAIDIEGHTPLYLAAADGTAEVAALLIDEHANVATPAKDGRTPLHMALSRGEDGFDIAKSLLGFDSNSEANPYSNVTANGDATPLHVAAEYGPPEAIEMLIQLGANINSTDEYGQTALLISIYQENWVIANILLDAGADVKADDRNGYTPLLGAVLGGQEDIVEQLLGAGADFDAVNEDGYSSIHLAVSQNEFNILRQLLKAGANIDAVNKLNNQTPLHIAVRRGHTGMVQILLESQANTELLNHLNFSPLQYALYRGDLEIVKEFALHDKSSTAAKATLQRGKDGDTPLHTLCRWTHKKADEQTMCNMLDKLLIVASEMDLNAKNDEGYTPLDLALSMATEYHNFIDKLVAKGAKPGSEE